MILNVSFLDSKSDLVDFFQSIRNEHLKEAVTWVLLLFCTNVFIYPFLFLICIAPQNIYEYSDHLIVRPTICMLRHPSCESNLKLFSFSFHFILVRLDTLIIICVIYLPKALE